MEPVEPEVVRFGRYTVERRLGAGGMGVVYLAFDPQLDRHVALKVLRNNRPRSDEPTDSSSPTAPAGSSSEGARLLREARALARLTHPNVITVHDVGEQDGQVFLAMEYLDGGTLGQWSRAPGRTFAEKLDALLRAGRGLLAAHDAGLVHRDFKPDNVLVGADDRVRVTDFGLARLEGVPGLSRKVADDLLAVPETQPGTLVGSPAYMAPEQLRGEPADARSDLFAFCVSAYEVLTGERPFAGRTIFELHASIEARRLARPELADRLPAPIRRALLEGLSAQPAARPASMRDLLRKLERPASRRGLLAAAAALAGLAAIGATRPAVRAAIVCRRSDSALRGAWDGELRGKLRASFAASGRAFSAVAARDTEAALDAWARSWSQQRRAACEAAIRGEGPPDLPPLRISCLEARRQELAARAQIFAQADGPVVDRASTAVAALPALAPCADERALRDRTRPPPEVVAPHVATLRVQLADLGALEQAGRAPAALNGAKTALDEAGRLGYRPLEAEAAQLLGDVLMDMYKPKDAAQAFARAAAAAAAGGADASAARAWTSFGQAQVSLAATEEAARAVEQARAAIERIGGDAVLQAELLRLQARLAGIRGKNDERAERSLETLQLVESTPGHDPLLVARALLELAEARRGQARIDDARAAIERARGLLIARLGPDHPDVIHLLGREAQLFLAEGRFPEANALLEKQLALTEKAVGSAHPLVGRIEYDLGRIARQLGKLDDADRLYRRAIELVKDPRIPDDPQVATIQSGLALIEAQRGHYPECQRLLDQVLATQTRSYGEGSLRVAETRSLLGGLLVEQRKFAEGVPVLEASLAAKEALLGPRHPDLVNSLRMLAGAELMQHRYERALPWGERALAIQRERLRADHPDLVTSYERLGEALLGLDRMAEARADLEEAVRIGELTGMSDAQLAHSRTLLGQALWATRDRRRAVALVKKVLVTYRQKPDLWASEIAELETWLRGKG